jgi:hypothetical protein
LQSLDTSVNAGSAVRVGIVYNGVPVCVFCDGVVSACT